MDCISAPRWNWNGDFTSEQTEDWQIRSLLCSVSVTLDVCVIIWWLWAPGWAEGADRGSVNVCSLIWGLKLEAPSPPLWCQRCSNGPGGADGVTWCPALASCSFLLLLLFLHLLHHLLLLPLRRGLGSRADATVAPLAGIEQRRVGHVTPGNMEAAAEELRAGSRLPVTVDQVVNDTLVVTLTYRDTCYTGILLDCSKKWVWIRFIFIHFMPINLPGAELTANC